MVSLKQKAYEILKSRIILCEYLPGTVIDEKAIVGELEISRTPVREAINTLSQEGYLTILPRQAIIVSQISVKDVNDLYEMRALVEPYCARIAAKECSTEQFISLRSQMQEGSNMDVLKYAELDSELHMAIASCTRNSVLVKDMRLLMEQTQRIRMLSSDFETRRNEGLKEHIDLINAILDQNEDAAEQKMRMHILAAQDAFGMVYDRYPRHSI